MLCLCWRLVSPARRWPSNSWQPLWWLLRWRLARSTCAVRLSDPLMRFLERGTPSVMVVVWLGLWRHTRGGSGGGLLWVLPVYLPL